MVSSFDYQYENVNIRVVKSTGNKSVGVGSLAYSDYDAIMCCHTVTPDLWCARIIILDIMRGQWVERFIQEHPVDVFHVDIRKGFCTFFINDLGLIFN